MPMVLIATVLDSQCITNGVGSYIESEITKLPMELDLTLVDGQYTTNVVGFYVDGQGCQKFPFWEGF